jgi:DNA-binding Lrp family transcriptional regulator
MLDKEAYMKEGPAEALGKAITFTIDAYSHSGLVSDEEVIQELQRALKHFRARSLFDPRAAAVNNIEAFVLINCDLGMEDAILRDLANIPEVSEIKGVFGVYDLIVRVGADSEEDIKRVISHIRSMAMVKSSVIMMVIENRASPVVGP